jgi:hypothetical protein
LESATLTLLWGRNAPKSTVKDAPGSEKLVKEGLCGALDGGFTICPPIRTMLGADDRHVRFS